jgi:hypothetical protein
MHPGDLDDFDHVRKLEPDPPSSGPDQEKSSMRSAQFSPMRVSSLAIRPAISCIGST